MLSATAITLGRGVALALLGPAVALLPASNAHAAGTCHGVPATIEASTGTVTGTAGADVIVATGTVRRVDAGDGDDLVCLVSTSKRVMLGDGAGNDVLDASAAGASTQTSLGVGADSFIGSDHDDYVGSGTLAPMGALGDPGPDQVSTGSGPDTLVVRKGAVVDADLGKGSDGLFFETAEGVPASRFDLGAGRDAAHFEDWWEDPGSGDSPIHVDLARDVVDWHGTSFPLRGAEDVRASAQRVVVLGSPGRNRFWTYGCDVLMKGGDGNDALFIGNGSPETPPSTCPPGRRLRAFGNAGNDQLEGSRRHDVLVGGPGRDSAYGGPSGNDRCDAERISGKGCLL